MKSDVIVLGAELDGLLAAVRLTQQGLTVQMLSTGAGGLHYAPAGLHVLGFKSGDCKDPVVDPISAISELSQDHPYRKIGADLVGDALSWYSEFTARLGLPVSLFAKNELGLTPAGLVLPVFGAPPHFATLEACKGQSIAIVRFSGMRDFPAELICASLANMDITAQLIDVTPPGKVIENVGLAKSFDRLNDLSGFFKTLKSSVPADADVVLFPAVMGLRRSAEVLSCAENTLGHPCFEVPTLPTSVPGLRQELALREYLLACGVESVLNCQIEHASATSEGIVITDANSRTFEATAAIVSTGGVLMGGLEIQSDGIARETMFDLGVVQTSPLSVTAVDQTLDALHKCGVETDNQLNPIDKDGVALPNLFVTGQTLANCNPAAELSADGLAIATGWVAANNASAYLEGAKNG